MTPLPAPADMPTVTVATWNILTAPVEILDRMEEAAAWLEDVDVLCVQEAVHYSPGDSGTAHILASKLGMKVAALTYDQAVLYGETTGYGTAVLTKLPIQGQHVIDLSPAGGTQKDASLALLETPNGHPFYVVSAHLAWGGHSEPIRLRQAALIEDEMCARTREYVQHHGKTPITLLGMDANTLPESDTIRYLTGLTGGPDGAPSALWVDAWKLCGEGPGFTSVVDGNPHSIMTARTKNIARPEMIPPRRIDYLMMRGWVYGSAGHPFSCEIRGDSSRLGTTFASDHNAVVATIWDPPPIS